MPPTTRRPLEDQNPIVLELLRLAAEIILAHPGAAPPALYDLCDTWADDLASALSCPGSSTTPQDHREANAPMQDKEAAPAGPLLTAGAISRGTTDGARITTARAGSLDDQSSGQVRGEPVVDLSHGSNHRHA